MGKHPNPVLEAGGHTNRRADRHTDRPQGQTLESYRAIHNPTTRLAIEADNLHKKARRSEIDSAISFIRNAALTTQVSKYAFAPVCRNLAGILRGALYISTFGYSDEQLPDVLAHDVYDLATCHTLFPFDTSDFVCFLSDERSTQTDGNTGVNWHLMMDRAGEVLGIRPLIKAVDQQARLIWESYSAPFAWVYDEAIWTQEVPSLFKELYYIAQRAFHQR